MNSEVNSEAKTDVPNVSLFMFISSGKHEHLFGSRLLRGMIDEFYIFPCELSRLDILVLMRHCRVYFRTYYFLKGFLLLRCFKYFNVNVSGERIKFDSTFFR